MYFTNRTEAGDKLADILLKYKGKRCTLVALSDGAVVVAAEGGIAACARVDMGPKRRESPGKVVTVVA